MNNFWEKVRTPRASTGLPVQALRSPQPSFTMGFDPQTADKPLVNVHKRTTKVNLAVVIAVLLFLVIGVLYAVRVIRKMDQGAPLIETPAVAP